MIKNSVINLRYSFSLDRFVVSFLHVGSFLTGHALLLLEGMHLSPLGVPELFVGQYDLQAIGLDGGLSSPDSGVSSELSALLQSIKNIHGLVCEIRMFEGNSYGRDYATQIHSSTSRSYYISPSNAQKMIDSIKADQDKVKAFIARLSACGNDPHKITQALADKSTYITYQTYGEHASFGRVGRGINCAQWCNEKLAIGGIGDGRQISKPKGCILM